MSPSILITAFEPYDVWTENSSWLVLMEFTKNMPPGVRLVTRLYPVNLQGMRDRLEQDLAEDFDYALHLGQAPGTSGIRLEAIAVNIGGSSKRGADSFQPLVADGPVAYRSALPLAQWARQLRELGVPAKVSFHAGTYLCNAILYLSQHMVQRKKLKTQTTFLHFPLDITQALGNAEEIAALPTHIAVTGLRHIVVQLATPERPASSALV